VLQVLKKAWSFDSEDSDVHHLCVEGEQQKLEIAAKNELAVSNRGRSVSTRSATISACSLTASSAGDVSSLGADDSNSSQYSRAGVQEQESTKKIKSCVAPAKNKFSYPISSQSLQKKLQDTFEIDESNDEDFYFEDTKALDKDFDRFKIADSSLANIQEKVGVEIFAINFL
jgi:hypothetical protein